MTSPLSVLPDAPPRFRNVPAAVSSAGLEAVELAESAGLTLDPWEADVLEGALGERPDGRWAAFEVGLVVPRQNGKGAILEARELAGLFLFGDDLILHSAHEFKTASEAFRRLWGLIQDTPDLDRRVAKVRTSHGDEGIELLSGQRIRFVARSTGSGRGFTGDCVILDEAYNLPAAALEALMPTMAARSMTGNPQIWYPSSAPLPRDESTTLRKLCKRGRAGLSPNLAYFEWSADGSSNLDDRESWKQANPGLGIRISEEFVATEREAMTDEGFARERLGIFPEDAADSWEVIASVDWERAVDPRMKLEDPVTFAVDVTPDRRNSSISVAGQCGDRVGIELVEARDNVAWLFDKVVALNNTHHPRMVVIDGKSQASTLVENLTDAGVPVRVINFDEAKQAAAGLYDGLVEGTVVHMDQPRLTAAAAGAVKRFVGDAWLWNRRAGTDITPLVSSGLALWGHLHPDPVEPPLPVASIVLLSEV